MASKTFIDTNILVYAYDIQAERKHQIAAQQVESLWQNRSGVVSLQVMQEFYVTLTQKISNPLPPKKVKDILLQYTKWETVQPTTQFLFSSMDLHHKLKCSFWDALIIQAALSSECTLLLSEDLQHGQKIQNLTIQNPFM